MTTTQAFTVVLLDGDSRRATLRPVTTDEASVGSPVPFARAQDVPLLLSASEIGTLNIGDTIDATFTKRQVTT